MRRHGCARRQAARDKNGTVKTLCFRVERSAVHLSLFIIIMGDVVWRWEIRAEMDLLTYLVLPRHQRCLNLERARQETFLRGRTRGWTWPLTPWWTWRRTVTWPPSWEAIWRGDQTQIVNFWRPMKTSACQGELIFIIDWKPTSSQKIQDTFFSGSQPSRYLAPYNN